MSRQLMSHKNFIAAIESDAQTITFNDISNFVTLCEMRHLLLPFEKRYIESWMTQSINENDKNVSLKNAIGRMSKKYL